MQAYFVIVQNVIGERDQKGKPLLYKQCFFLFFVATIYKIAKKFFKNEKKKKNSPKIDQFNLFNSAK